MTKTGALIAFLATTNPSRALIFYRDIIGLTFVADEPFALVFENESTMIRIQKVESLSPHPFTSLGWKVGVIRNRIKELKNLGIRFEVYDFLKQDNDGIWQTPDGSLIAWFKDPDGNLLSLTQF
ncbi:MAG: hypothetical protein JNM27_03580 [Leptospirales bacterium]|nr:hypothetical protein [Leptospirales bacterium]